nr:retrotransposon protein, putative, Ty1-copia subclass [Tanacetum cinerariifolium]
MAITAQNTNNLTIRLILLAEKLTGSNFPKWYHNLRIVLKYEKKLKFAKQPIRPILDPKTIDPDIIDKYYESMNLEQEVACLMLSSMSLDLQRTLMKYNAFYMMKELKTMFEEQAKQNCLKELKLPCLQTRRWSEKEKTKLAYAPKPKIPPLHKRDNPAKGFVCHHYKDVGHWRRNCPSYHVELKKRENANISSTLDDFSHYGYVYLMKHKHKVFETFKVFQNKVENQLSKKIKVIRSDRGGEYMSHEFVNHMKCCGIVSQLTLPYTPQHNEVSKRRNQNLLDMVRSMMNLTTLPKSFWGYVLESAARILNMVLTKKNPNP